MPLLIQPLFGDSIIVPFSPPISWREVYSYLCTHHFQDARLDQLCLYHNESSDLSSVRDGDTLRLFVNERMAERWITEYSTDAKNDGIRFYHSTLSWYDIRWGDPYEYPAVLYRTSLTVHILMREHDGTRAFMLNPVFFQEQYTTRDKSAGIWYSTLREACYAFRNKWNATEGEEAVTEKTVEHFIHLWELYHGTHKHLVDQGRYYDY